MEHLYAPWRDSYVTGTPSKRSCIFCVQSQAADDMSHYILSRHEYCFVMLNLYPYNAGHIMVIPYRHTAFLHKLKKAELHEIMEVVSGSTQVLKKTLKAEGFNIGVNIGGKVAGGSIADHLHVHVIPRWHGDTSFLTTAGGIKPISVDLPKLYEKLIVAFQK
jgi:ATP adenylyltransferase